MIVEVCRLTPRPGQEAASKDAARELSIASQGRDGILGYFWNTDETSSDLLVVEIFQDEASIFAHIERSDLSQLLAAAVFKEIVLYGDPPSSTLRELLSGVCDLTVHPAL